jgi:hypothetical protein
MIMNDNTEMQPIVSAARTMRPRRYVSTSCQLLAISYQPSAISMHLDPSLARD